MTLSGRSRGVVLLVAGIAFTASAQLNPTVAVLANASGQVPVECEQGLAPQKMARLDVAQIPEPQTSSASLVAPPSVTLRDTLKAAQTAAEQNDRNDFTNAVSRAHSLIASYPPGAERTAAADVIRIFDDVDRIWSYQFESPTGAFFDASNPLFATLRSYPGYEAAVADDVITNAGTRLYPSHESRTFLLRESSRRLARLGVRSGVQVVERPRRAEPPAHPLPRVVPRRAGSKAPKTTAEAETAHRERSHKRKPHASSSTASTVTPPAAKTTAVRQHEHTTAASEKSAAQRAAHHEAVKVADAKAAHEATRYDAKRSTAEAGPKAVPPAATATTPPAPAPAGSMTATTPPPATTSSAPPPTATTATGSAATSSTPLTSTASTTTAPATASTTALTTTAGDASTSSTASPTMSDTTATTSTAAAPAQPNRTRSVVLPIILILLGVGVLVVLFRASS